MFASEQRILTWSKHGDILIFYVFNKLVHLLVKRILVL